MTYYSYYIQGHTLGGGGGVETRKAVPDHLKPSQQFVEQYTSY